MRYYLKDFTLEDFPILNHWVTDADLLLQFSGTDFTYPLTEKQILDYQQTYTDRRFYIGIADNVPFAFGEIIPQENGVPRLGRILIGDINLRGQGLGRIFAKLLVKLCKELYDSNAVDLFVWDQNLAAIKCYQSVGFKLNPEKYKTLFHEGKSYDIYRMTFTH